MARYRGPKHRIARREGLNVLDKTSATLQRRLNIPPGVHGRKRKRGLSEFGQQLREKQRAKATYGLLERQFKKLVKEVAIKRGDTAELLISSLEKRLDNIVYRLGFAKTRFQSRQFVTHGHVYINDKRVTIPSFQVKEGMAITISKQIQENPSVLEKAKEEDKLLPYLKRSGFLGKLVRSPKREDVDVLFNPQLIIEYYSR